MGIGVMTDQLGSHIYAYSTAVAAAAMAATTTTAAVATTTAPTEQTNSVLHLVQLGDRTRHAGRMQEKRI